jgi:hypothetical protein
VTQEHTISAMNCRHDAAAITTVNDELTIAVVIIVATAAIT